MEHCKGSNDGEELLHSVSLRTNKMIGKGDAGVSQPRMPIRGSRNPNSDSEFDGPRISESHKQIQANYPNGGATKVSYLSFPSSSFGVDSHDIAEGVGAECQDGIKLISSHPGHDIQLGKHELWPLISKEKGQEITDIVCNWYVSLSEPTSMPKDSLIAEDYPSTKVSPKDSNADDNMCGKVSPSNPIVQYVDINIKSTSYVGAAGASTKEQPKVSSNFRPLVADLVFNGVNISIPRKVVEKRLAFLVVEYYARNNWGKHGLKRIMMNSKGFVFFKFDSKAGLEAVLESSPWMIRNTLIILKKWLVSTRLLKEELTRILIWSFARCLIEVNSEADLVDVVTIGIPSLTRDDFRKETIHVEYEWRPSRCDECKIFGHVHDHCLIKVVSPPIVTTSNVAPTVEKSNLWFPNVRYEPKASTNAPKKGATIVSNPSKSSSMLKTADSSPKKDNFTTSNSFSPLNDDEEVDNVHDESANLFPNTKPVEDHISRLLLDCKVLVEKAKNKIGDWKNKSLSFAGRLQLCKSVISSIHVYWASVLVIPKGIIYDIQQIIRGFLWCNSEYKHGKAKVHGKIFAFPRTKEVLDIQCLLVQWLTPRDISREGFTLQCHVADFMLHNGWIWPQAWLLKAPNLGMIQVSQYGNVNLDTYHWRDSNGNLKEFSVGVLGKRFV
nr:hypothetical protein [Tanacetum cinerariifolium]